MNKSKHKQSYKELLEIMSSTGITNSELQEELNLSRRKVSYLILKIRELGVIIRNEYIGVVVYYSVENMERVRELRSLI